MTGKKKFRCHSSDYTLKNFYIFEILNNILHKAAASTRQAAARRDTFCRLADTQTLNLTTRSIWPQTLLHYTNTCFHLLCPPILPSHSPFFAKRFPASRPQMPAPCRQEAGEVSDAEAVQNAAAQRAHMTKNPCERNTSSR
ncbi:hypothetical protein HMPREF9371_1404 [Neisseria shayeganii 871]|uniref:Uncharacterized protein n=1 Tax=Neisseria shayeganii 871 TaxID=1032488 RepID=G4CIE4_9NEIS|nr:hypothetical protein HMPREF9371_1404 [Neisseria shayeganii 871]